MAFVLDDNLSASRRASAENFHNAACLFRCIHAISNEVDESLFQLIGIALNNQPQLLLGAACTALLALLLDGLVTMASRLWLERGLRPS